jgi:photosystem II stability/assembly factor-like uncharacterized protein
MAVDWCEPVWAGGAKRATDTSFLGYSVDGGETWNSGRVTAAGLNDVSFVTGMSGWAVGKGGTILSIKL